MTTGGGNTGLFLHGGPGLSAVVERQWFGPDVDLEWWDQPSVAAGDPAPLVSLVEAAKDRLLELHRRQRRRIDVVSHSVGAILAVLLLREVPELIWRVTLINPTFDLRQAFLGIARRAVGEGTATPEVSAFVHEARPANVDPVELAVALSAVPGRFDMYWSPSSAAAKARYLEMAPSGPPVDFESFSRIAAAMQTQAPALLGVQSDVPVLAIVGASDPMMPGDVNSYVRQRVPLASVAVVDAGHMAPFEQPALAWPDHLQRRSRWP